MEIPKMKKVTALILAFLLLFSLAACGQADKTPTAEKEKITFMLDWTPNTNHTGLYVAKALGYFDEVGLDVEITQPPEGDAESLVGAGKAQFGISFQDTMAAALCSDSALPITAFAALIQHNTSGIVSLKGNGITSPKGMQGKKYATWDAPIEKAMIKNVVEGDGGDFSKVELIPSTASDEVSALQSKQIDAIWIFYAWAGIKMQVENIDVDYFAFKDLNPVFDYYTPVVIANNDFLKQNPETAKKFLSALKKGYEYAISNPEAAADILCSAAPELDKTLVLESQKYLAQQYKAEVSRWGYIDPARWNAFYNWLNDNNLAASKLPENTGFTNDYLPE